MAVPDVNPQCPRCQGERVDVRIAGLAELVIAPFDQKWHKNVRGHVGVSGVACTSCGLVELYATNPERLRPT